MRFFLVLSSFLLFGLGAFCQNQLLSGLHFSSHEVTLDKRTSLNLTPTTPLKFPKGFSLEMEANFRNGDGHYGYIFRIIGDGKTKIDLVSNLASSTSPFRLVLKDKVIFSFKWTDIPKGDFNRWIKIKMDVDILHSKLAISFNGNKQVSTIPDIAGLKHFSIVFGASWDTVFYNTDVSPMSLKNIRIYDENEKLFREWKLSKHGQTNVYDEINNEKALVKNPIWIIDKHVKWQKLKTLKFTNLIGLTKDEDRGRILFVDDWGTIYMLNTRSMSIDTIPSHGKPRYKLGKQFLYNKYTNEIWSYNFSNTIRKINLSNYTESFIENSEKEAEFWHHNKFISPVDSSLVTLFGYGNYTYKSIINRYIKKSQSWEKIDCSNQIQPRYMSSTGFLNNQELLVFGGYGSKSGQQDLSPGFYYDLYKFDLKNDTFKKIWNLKTPSIPFVPCEDLIPDAKSGCFYTLVYNSGNYKTHLHLAKFGLEKNDYQIFEDSIPYHYLDSESWCTLFLDKEASQLIAITSNRSEVSLYAIAYPPLTPDAVYQNSSSKNRWYIWFFFILLAGGLFAMYGIFRKKKNRIVSEIAPDNQMEHADIVPLKHFERKINSAIHLMGGFQIFDRKGRNITAAFSPVLKHLFLFLYLHTIKNNRGVSSAKLDEVLWYDKTEKSARNNRNVNISKLRLTLEELKDIRIINENTYWKINTDKRIYCDYSEILVLLGKLKTTKLTENEIHELLGLLSTGEFLPMEQTEWMDQFKSNFTNEVVDGLSALLCYKELKNNATLRYHIADCLLIHDSLNDDALTIKCTILYHYGKKSMAKNLYDSFCKNYANAFGVDFSTPFNDLVR